MSNARIVQLVPDGANAISFEEAFGDYSNMSSKRKNRKMKKISDKKEIRAAKQEAKTEKKVGHQQMKSAKKVARQEKIGSKKSAKQSRKSDVSEQRQERKGSRKTARLERRHLGDQYDEPVEEELETGGVTETEQMGSSQQPVGEGEAEESYDEAPEEGEESYEEQAEEDESEEGDDSSDDGDGYDESEFAGEKDINIHPRVFELVNKIEWNKEMLARMFTKKAALLEAQKTTNKIDSCINGTQERVNDLMHKLQAFSSIGGKDVQVQRHKEIKLASKVARKRRADANKKTVVEEGLSPEITDNKIVVPSTSNMAGDPNAGIPNGSGMNSMDLADDFDAPEPLVVEMSSNFGGLSLKNINWKGVAIGVGVATVAIIAINKLIKK